LRAKASWGQNFLDDEPTLQRIVDAANLGPEDSVVELGAGLGHLTRLLVATGAQVIAIERDPDLLEAMGELRAENLRVIAANAAHADFAALAGTSPVVVVGNIPYQLTSTILFELLDQRAHISRAVLTMQKEVAGRITAPPGGRDYGILSVLLGLHYELQNLFVLQPALFHPPPKVSSAVIRLDALSNPRAEVLSDGRFRKLVKAAFARRRKQLLNSLKSDPSLGEPASLLEALRRANIDPTRRAETLSVQEFAALERALG
ncbi:MAG TPA: 16S rRNA (adenine(1518)-N(6)/adenine(1519)-N(6))-dimethyltransferase RsmA, partial [Myxococcaceae bacterium]|nr:16S rRNA (adenine(1518)-N(6)/adenine(1519)-N(6))-dimethyltransferase RsmA [Myxococcaceae bacterium]